MNNSVDISKLIQALSKMPKEQLDAGIAKANRILQNKDTNDILNQINKKI